MAKNKKAAIELSIGTVVIIVLAMSMLILGIVLIRNIYSGAIDSVKTIDRGVKNEINKLFSSDIERKVVLYPDSALIKLKQGSSDEGFALSIRNVDSTGVGRFTYSVSMADDQADLRQNCGRTDSPIDNWAKIVAGKDLSTNNAIELSAGNSMEDPLHIRFSVSSTAPTCLFRVKVDVRKDGTIYDTKFMDIQIVPK